MPAESASSVLLHPGSRKAVVLVEVELQPEARRVPEKGRQERSLRAAKRRLGFWVRDPRWKAQARKAAQRAAPPAAAIARPRPLPMPAPP